MRLVSVQDPLGRTRQYQWCGCGALSAWIDPMGRMTLWRRDVQGRVTAKEYADGSRVTYEYEKTTSRLHRRRDEQNQITEYTYDVADSLLSRRYLNPGQPTPAVFYTYDSAYDRIVSMTDGNGTTRFSYRPFDGNPGAGRIAAIDGPWERDVMAFEYDILGRLSRRSVDGVAVLQNYDVAGRVQQITNALGIFNYSWDAGSDRLLAVAYPNGQRTDYAYFDNAGEHLLKQISNSAADGSKLSEFGYSYDLARRIAGWTQMQAGQSKVWTLARDASDRLTNLVETVGGNPAVSSSWNYDSADNRTAEWTNGVARGFNFNVLNQVTSAEATQGLTSYLWDAEQRLVAISNATSQVKFEYDGLGRRTRVVELQGAQVVQDRKYIWYGLELCEERDSTGGVPLKRYFSHGIENVAAPELPAGRYFVTRDHLGSVRDVTSTTTTAFGYSPFGERLRLGGSGSYDFGFTGHFYHSGTGTVLAPFRAYLPSFGQWLSRDPIGEVGGANLYRYANTDPITFVDPDGSDPAATPTPPVLSDIINVVAADPVAVKFIDDPAYRSKGNKAGASRNGDLRRTGKPFDQHLPTGVQDYVCDGIAERASDLIINGIHGGSKPLAGKVKKVEVIHLKIGYGQYAYDHEAVQVTLPSGDQYVLDWHATLDITHPEITKPADFCSGILTRCGSPAHFTPELK